MRKNMGETKPILFNARMVRAVLDGKKTVTLRLIRFPANQFTGRPPDPGNIRVHKNTMRSKSVGFTEEPGWYFEATLPYHAGDILYVRETFSPYCINTERCSNAMLGHAKYCYRATAGEDCVDGLHCKWIPSIHMPKGAARIWLEVTNVKAGRLQDITEEQAVKEGCAGIREFREIWQDTVPPWQAVRLRMGSQPMDMGDRIHALRETRKLGKIKEETRWKERNSSQSCRMNRQKEKA